MSGHPHRAGGLERDMARHAVCVVSSCGRGRPSGPSGRCRAPWRRASSYRGRKPHQGVVVVLPQPDADRSRRVPKRTDLARSRRMRPDATSSTPSHCRVEPMFGTELTQTSAALFGQIDSTLSIAVIGVSHDVTFPLAGSNREIVERSALEPPMNQKDARFVELEVLQPHSCRHRDIAIYSGDGSRPDRAPSRCHAPRLRSPPGHRRRDRRRDRRPGRAAARDGVRHRVGPAAAGRHLLRRRHRLHRLRARRVARARSPGRPARSSSSSPASSRSTASTACSCAR